MKSLLITFAVLFMSASVAISATPSALQDISRPGIPGGSLAGTYEQESTGANGRKKSTLVLKDDNTYTLTTEYTDRASVVEKGTWSVEAKLGKVKLVGSDDQPRKSKMMLRMEGNTLVATEYDKERYGSEGMKLKKKPTQ